jgi:hypothetical protein
LSEASATPPTTPKPKKKRGWLPRLLIAAGLGVSTLALTGFVGWAWLRSESGERLLTRQIEGAVQAMMTEGTFTIGELDTDLWGNLGVSDVHINDANGSSVIFLPRADVQLSLLPLLFDRRLVIRRATVYGPDVTLHNLPQGGLNLTQLFPTGDPDAPRGEDLLPIDLTIRQLKIRNGTVTLNGAGAHKLSLDARLDYTNDVLQVTGLDVAGEWVGESLDGPLIVSGGLLYDWDADRIELPQIRARTLDSILTAEGEISALSTSTDLDIDLLIDALAMERLDPVVLGNAGFQGVWTGDAHIGGDPTHLDITAVLDDTAGVAGGLDVAVGVDLGTDDMAWTAKGQLRSFELNGLLAPVAQVVRIDGGVNVCGHGTSWPNGMVIEGTVKGGPQLAYGFDMDQLAGDFRIEDGILNLVGVNVVTPYADLIGNGGLDLINGPMDLKLVGSVMPTGLESMNLPGLSGTGRTNLRIRGDVMAETLDLSLVGTASFDRFNYQGLVDIGSLRSTIDGRIGTEQVSLGLGLNIADLASSGVQIATGQAPAVDVVYRFDGNITATSEAMYVQNIHYPGVFIISEGSGELDFRMPPSGAYVAEVDMVLGNGDMLGYTTTTGLVAATITPQTAAFDVWLQDGFRTLARTVGTYDLADAEVDLLGLTAAPIPGGDWTAKGPLHFNVAEGGISNARIDIISTHGRIRVRGDLATVGQLDGLLRVDNLDLAYIDRLIPSIEQTLTGQLDVNLALSGLASNTTVDGTVRGEVAVDGNRPLDMDVILSVNDGRAEVDGIFLSDTVPLATLRGVVPVKMDLAGPDLDRNGFIDAELIIAPGDFARMAELIGSTAPLGGLSAVASVRGPIRDPDLHLVGVLQMKVPGLANDGRVEFAIDRVDRDVELWTEVMEGYGLVGSIDGSAKTQLQTVFAWVLGESDEAPDWTDYDAIIDSLNVDIETDDLPVASVVDYLGMDTRLTGYLQGDAHIRGSASSPTIDGELVWEEAAIEGLALTQASGILQPDSEGGYNLTTILAFEDGGRLDIGGNVPVAINLRNDYSTWSDGPLDITVDGSDIPVRALASFIPGATRGAGTLRMNGTVAGTLFEPSPDVTIELRDGEMAYAPSGVLYKEATADILVRSDLIELTNFSVETDARRGIIAFTDEFTRRTIEASAQATLDGWFPGDVTGSITMRNAWLSGLTELQIQTSGDIGVSGVYPNLDVRGDIVVDNGLIVQDLASFLTVSPLALDERIRVERTDYEKRDIVEETAEPGLYETIDISINVDLQRNVEVQVAFPFLDDLGAIGATVTRADVQTRLGGDIDFAMTGGEMSLFGPVDVVGGKMRVLQTSFDLTDGSATFQGSPFDPILDLAANSEIGTATVDLSVSGTASEPIISFTSTQYPDQSQILAMLITGREPDTLNADQGSAATEALVGLLLSSVLSGARLGSISYDPDGTVRVGIPVASDVYFQTILATQPSINDNQFAGHVEWTIAPKVVLEVTVGDQQSNGDLFWETRF